MANTLVEIYGKLSTVTALVEAAYMASSDLDPEQAGPMQTLLDLTNERLQEAKDELEAHWTGLGEQSEGGGVA